MNDDTLTREDISQPRTYAEFQAMLNRVADHLGLPPADDAYLGFYSHGQLAVEDSYRGPVWSLRRGGWGYAFTTGGTSYWPATRERFISVRGLRDEEFWHTSPALAGCPPGKHVPVIDAINLAIIAAHVLSWEVTRG